jgi:hypothetical protein
MKSYGVYWALKSRRRGNLIGGNTPTVIMEPGPHFHRNARINGQKPIRVELIEMADEIGSPTVCACEPDKRDTDGEGVCLNCGGMVK